MPPETAAVAPAPVMTLADGRQLDALTGKIISGPLGKEEEPSGPIGIVAKRTLGEIKLPVRQMNAVALVAAYHIWGLSPRDIGAMLGLDEDKVKSIQAEVTYTTFFNESIKSVLDSELADVRDNIAKSARKAAQIVKTRSEDSDDPKTQLKAAQDILDRAQLRPVDMVVHKHTMEGALRIVYEKAGSTLDLPKDIEFTEIETKDGDSS